MDAGGKFNSLDLEIWWIAMVVILVNARSEDLELKLRHEPRGSKNVFSVPPAAHKTVSGGKQGKIKSSLLAIEVFTQKGRRRRHSRSAFAKWRSEQLTADHPRLPYWMPDGEPSIRIQNVNRKIDYIEIVQARSTTSRFI